MRKILRLVLAVVLFSLVVAADLPIPNDPHAGTQADPWIIYNSPTVSLAWDAGEADVYGVEMLIKSQAGAEILRQPILKTDFDLTVAGTWKVALRAIVDPLPNGIYEITARHFDVIGNTSDWATPVWARKEWRKLTPPGGCRLLR